MDIDFSRELTIAKRAALEAGNFLRKSKDNLNKHLYLLTPHKVHHY